MNKKILLLSFLLVLFLFLINTVHAAECNTDEIRITSLVQKEIKGSTKVISEPTFEGRIINLNLKMVDVGDNVSYDLTITNDSDEDFYIDENSFGVNSEYIEYKISTKDGSNIIKAHSSKELVLGVTYTEEVPKEKLTDHKANLNNKIVISMNNTDKQPETPAEEDPNALNQGETEKALEPPAEQEDNPNTTNAKVMAMSLFSLSAIIIIYIAVRMKQYRMLMLGLFLVGSIPAIYAICRYDVEVESNIEIEPRPELFDILKEMSEETNACATKYEGQVTDEVGKTVEATNVYFNNCPEKRTVIFADACWQVIRTTETGGVKMVYYGLPVEGTCVNNRPRTNVYSAAGGRIENIGNNIVYGDGFTYDEATSTFKLEDTFTADWNESTYPNVAGKFTCNSTSDTCENVYNITNYMDATTGYGTKYSIGSFSNRSIGSGSFNALMWHMGAGGYMFNEVYMYEHNNTVSNILYGSSFTYDKNTHMYTLAGQTKSLYYYNNNYSEIDNMHYSCLNTTGTCETIAYFTYTHDYYFPSTGYSTVLYFKDGIGIEDALKNAINGDNVNKYDSSVKAMVDNWYKHKMTDYTDMLEDNVYCNDRSFKNIGTFNPNGGSAANASSPTFKNAELNGDLSCANLTDQFSTSNNKAKLTYPTALLTSPEAYNITIPFSPGGFVDSMWLMSPHYTYSIGLDVNHITHLDKIERSYAYNGEGVRPVVSLKPKTKILSGDGSEANPWVIYNPDK